MKLQPAKIFRAAWRSMLAFWLVTSLCAAAAEFHRVLDGVGYVRVGSSQNNVYVVGPHTNALIMVLR